MDCENALLVDQLLAELLARQEFDAAEYATEQAARREKVRRKNVLNSLQRKLRQRGVIPQWANTFFIGEIYDLARLRTRHTGMQWEVDHIVPLQSPFVCGLHVEHNLRVILRDQNKAKGNRHWPDMPAAA